MTRNQLHRAVATATGDSLRTIRALGFHVVDDPEESIPCPTCGQAVPHPGFVCDGKPALAECLACDTYFDTNLGVAPPSLATAV
jgi:hypothetical protein